MPKICFVNRFLELIIVFKNIPQVLPCIQIFGSGPPYYTKWLEALNLSDKAGLVLFSGESTPIFGSQLAPEGGGMNPQSPGRFGNRAVAAYRVFDQVQFKPGYRLLEVGFL